MTTWIEALKIWNGKREGKKYMIPRKGTQEHAQVMSIMKGQQNGKGIVQLGRQAKKEFDDNKKLYKRTKKNIRDANATYEATKPLQQQTIQSLKRANSAVGKLGMIGLGGQSAGSLEKAIDFASNSPNEFAEFVNKVAQQGGGKKSQKGGFLPAFIIPFLPAITSALGTAAAAFATGAAGAAGAAAVDAIVGDGVKQKGGEIINPNVDIISEINNLWKGLIGMGLNQTQKNKLKKRIKGGMIDPRDISVASRISRDLMKTQQKGGLGWAELSAVNEVLYPLQPKLPSINTETGEVIPPSTPFDFLNITF